MSHFVHGNVYRLSPDGLTIVGLPGGPLALTVDETLALADFWRTPGARTLANRAWLAEQYAAVVTDEERPHKRHAGRAA